MVTLIDTSGNPVSGATVTFAVSGFTPTWIESQAVEVATPAGTYHQTLAAPAASGTGTLSATAIACTQSVSLNQTVALTVASPAPTTGYGGAAFQGIAGCSPVQGAVRVLASPPRAGSRLRGRAWSSVPLARHPS